jgi:hypothetical protein
MLHSKRRLLYSALLLRLMFVSPLSLAAATPAFGPPAAPKLDTILYGVAYYNEYMPAAHFGGPRASSIRKHLLC